MPTVDHLYPIAHFQSGWSHIVCVARGLLDGFPLVLVVRGYPVQPLCQVGPRCGLLACLVRLSEACPAFAAEMLVRGISVTARTSHRHGSPALTTKMLVLGILVTIGACHRS
jgi:hypothetical protein